MTKLNGISDSRLLSILRGGEILRSCVDSEGLLCDWKVASLEISPTLEWEAVFSLERIHLTVSGRFAEGGVLVATLCTDDYEARAAEKPFSSLLEAFGDLSGLPPHLKSMLSPVRLEIPGFEHVASILDDRFVQNEIDALFWGVDGGRPEDGCRKYFRRMRTRFAPDGKGKVELSSSYSFGDSLIYVKADVDVFGLGARKVVLEKNLGMGRFARCECVRHVGGRYVPSLLVAFDLADAIPQLYCRERRSAVKVRPKK